MKSKVYFADMHCRKQDDNKAAKIERLCEAVGLKSILKRDDLTAIKLHFGEMGNDTHIRPQLVRKVVDLVKQQKAKPFLTDTNTLYSGSRKNSVDHLATAYAHGFAPCTVDAPVIIADGLNGQSQVDVPVNLKHFKETHIGREIHDADSMVVLSHVKGHEMAGFGGALKNLVMGCASFWGKRDQHQTRVAMNHDICIGCASCAKICPAHAISMTKTDNGKKVAQADPDKCIGCFECITVCEPKAITANWETELNAFVERISEYAYGAVENKKDKVIFINFVLNVTPDCDCVSWSDAPMIADIGILASTDPVAIDKASYDLVTQAQSLHPMTNNGVGIDKFTHRWEHTHGYHQIEYAAEIGLGSLDYELIKI